MLLVLISRALSHALGFRYRRAHQYYRMLDVGGAFWLVVPFAGLYYGAAALARWLLPRALSESIASTLGLVLGVVAFGMITLWMPFIEHVSLTAPSELTPRWRVWVLRLARAIPYLYGSIGVVVGLVVGQSAAAAVGIVLARTSDLVFGVALAEGPRWLANSWTLVCGVAGIGVVLNAGRRDSEWGLPEWRTLDDATARHDASMRAFDLLDRTLGRAVLRFLNLGAAYRAGRE